MRPPPPPHRVPPPAVHRRFRAGFVLLAALLLALLWPRTSPESTLWMDEIHSLQLSQLPVSRIFDEAARDFHPPGYVLVLKGWLQAGRLLGEQAGSLTPTLADREPGVAWARGLNLVAWLLAVGGCWFVGGSVLGRRGGALLAVAVGASAGAGVVVQDLRSYAFAWAALTLAVVGLTALEHRPDGAARRLGWAAYSLTLAGALWSHLLAAPAVVLLTLTWATTRLLRPREARSVAGRRGRPGVGFLAHAVPWLLFLPWLLRVPDQVAGLRRADPSWMTPATAGELLRVFTRWLPLGRVAPPTPQVGAALAVLAGVAILVPLVAGLAAWRRGGRGEPRRPAATLALLALPTALGSIAAYWLIARVGIAATFHGPRYPMLVAGVFAAGLAGAALARRRPFPAALLLLPWLAVSLAGHALALGQEARPGGLAAFRPAVAAMAPGDDLYVSPSELRPFLRRTFAGFHLRPIEELICEPPRRAVVLEVNPWRDLDRTRDRILRRALHSGRLARRVTRRDWRDLQTRATAWRLRGIDARLAGQLCAGGLQPPSAVPPGAAAVAHAAAQAREDGWSVVEMDRDFRMRRWGTRPGVLLRFDRRISPGVYRLHLVGIRQPHPQDAVWMRLELEDGSWSVERRVPAGPFHLDVPLTVGRAQRPVVRLEHPVWSPAEETGSGDRRWLSFWFEEAWITPSPAASPP